MERLEAEEAERLKVLEAEREQEEAKKAAKKQRRRNARSASKPKKIIDQITASSPGKSSCATEMLKAQGLLADPQPMDDKDDVGRVATKKEDAPQKVEQVVKEEAVVETQAAVVAAESSDDDWDAKSWDGDDAFASVVDQEQQAETQDTSGAHAKDDVAGDDETSTKEAHPKDIDKEDTHLESSDSI